MDAKTEKKNLHKALQQQFYEDEAACLAELLKQCLSRENPVYEKIDMPREVKDECLLTAFGERLIVPTQSGPRGGWDDRSLRLQEGEYYMMPLLVRHLMSNAAREGELVPHKALENVLSLLSKEPKEGTRELVHLACENCRQGKIEAGLLYVVAQRSGLELDLHETLDALDLLGVVSPSSKGPVGAGLVWYELNPCLFY